jgi:hypothetical protein
LDKLKRFISLYKNQLYFSLVAIVGTLGVYVGSMTVDRYKTIVNGTLGSTVLYLLYEKFLSPRRSGDEPGGIQIELPQDLKKLFYAFFAAIVGFWAGAQVVNLVFYIVSILLRLVGAI